VFVDEAALPSIAQRQAARFLSAAPQQAAVDCKVTRVDAVQLASLDVPALAGPFGGDIPARRAADGRLLPLQPTFHVRLEQCDPAAPPRSERPGTAHLEGERRSLLGRIWQQATATWHREASL
jgi:putative peptide zinc metalloprotease protein